MENQLQHLGKRWATICHWTEQQWLLLQEVLLKWQSFAEDEIKFSDWLTEKEAVLVKMKTADLTDSQIAVEQVKELKVSINLREGKKQYWLKMHLKFVFGTIVTFAIGYHWLWLVAMTV